MKRSLSCEEADGTLLVTLAAECQEQIGKLVEMPTEMLEDIPKE